jgi:Lrp/AsnC family transcriptional regulator for asnA, asnC and gidA
MSVKIDETDAGILKALMEDGRRSLREIARVVQVSTPTVESRLKRLFDMGVIKKISPVLDPDKIEHGIYVLINLKADTSKIDEVTQHLAEMDEVRCVFMVTGESNITIRAVADDMKSLQELLTKKIAGLENVQILSSNVITRIIKEEQGVIIRPNLRINLRCDYCNRKIEGEPAKLRVGEQDRYFCCKVCLESYQEKYSSKIIALSKEAKKTQVPLEDVASANSRIKH